MFTVKNAWDWNCQRYTQVKAMFTKSECLIRRHLWLQKFGLIEFNLYIYIVSLFCKINGWFPEKGIAYWAFIDDNDETYLAGYCEG